MRRRERAKGGLWGGQEGKLALSGRLPQKLGKPLEHATARSLYKPKKPKWRMARTTGIAKIFEVGDVSPTWTDDFTGDTVTPVEDMFLVGY